MIKLSFAFAALSLFALPCAAEDLYTGTYSACMDRSGGVTVEMLNCISEELETQDAMLNSAYKKLGTQLSPARKQQLTSAQRLWLQYRDANCGFYADPDGGTLATVISNECFLRETAERAEELKLLGSGAE